MFAPSNERISRRRVQTLGVSILSHALFLLWLLYPPSAIVLAPRSVAYGDQGSNVIHLYWPGQSDRDDEGANPNSKETSSGRKKLVWKNRHKQGKKPVPVSNPATEVADAAAKPADQASPAHAAGESYGVLSGGEASGDDIRPALPVAAIDPVVSPGDLAGHPEGNEIIEITIDVQGKIVQKTVLQSLGPTVDNKVLAALESWHFLPATRNGVAIASKQDVSYHFKPS